MAKEKRDSLVDLKVNRHELSHIIASLDLMIERRAQQVANGMESSVPGLRRAKIIRERLVRVRDMYTKFENRKVS